MDTIATIIVTAFITSTITGIVSNFIFLRYQKRIETTFVKQLDEFRANLQYSNFERQTKFSTDYAKRIEILESLYRKFVALGRSMDKLNWDISRKRAGVGEEIDKIMFKTTGISREEVDFSKLIETTNKLFAEFQDYFDDNRFYLSPDTANEIHSIIEKMSVFFSALVEFSIKERGINEIFDAHEESTVRWINTEIAKRELGFTQLNLEKLDMGKDTLFLEISEEIEKLVAVVANHYKAELETK